ncbi:MAG: GldG family protein [Clostridiales bacterium]|nr:GldG family protein [Clostridiales bacterium]
MKNRNDNLNEGILDIELAAEQEEIKSRKFKYGTLATIFTIVFIIAVILVNVLVGYLTDRYVLEIDMTSERLFEISEDTMEVLDDLAEPITVTVLAEETTYRDSTELLSNIYEILQRYEALAAGKLTVRYINPTVNPKIVEQYNTLGDLASNDIIIESARRTKKLSPTTMYNAKTSDDGTTYYVGLRAEQKLTSAILYCTAETVSKAAYIRGHNEDYYMDELDAMLTTSNYEVSSIILAREDIPEDVNLIIISSPTVDFSLEEIDKLDEYFSNGGDAIISMTPNTAEELTNLNLYFEEWGIRYTDQLVFDSAQSLSGYPMYVVPNIATVEGITDNLNLRNQFALVVGGRAIELTNTQTGSDYVTVLMSSSATSYAKNANDITYGYDQADTDAVGPFNLAVMTERYAYDKNLNTTRSSLLFVNAGMITDSVLSASNFLNASYLTSALNFINDYSDAVIIPDKNFVSTTLNILTWQVMVVFWVVVVALPLAILAIGVIVWARRRHL